MNYSEVIFSNRFERLADALGRRLFSKAQHPFDKRLVVVPNEEIKHFLFYHFATDPAIGIAAGVQVLSLSQAFLKLFQWIEPENTKKIPSFLELSLQLEALIASMINQEVLQPLFNYLSQGRFLNHLGLFCDHLSHVFSRYGLYSEPPLKEWLLKEGWQQWLWKRVFEEDLPWTYPLKALSREVSCDFQVHLFGFNDLPTAQLLFFRQLNASFYQLSPCAFFWQDLFSQKEGVYLRRHFHDQNVKKGDIDAFERYTQDHNPLLANWGKLGRRHLKQLDLPTEEDYEEPKTDSLLGLIQRDLLEMREANVPEGLERLSSIQLHSTTSKLREIEVLYDVLCRIVDREGIAPRNIVVLAPEINEYVPLIHMVFGSKQSPFFYSIHDLECASTSDCVLGFVHLLTLPKERFSVAAVLKLFSFPSFMEKWTLTGDDLLLMRKWIKKARIRWGWNEKQRCQDLQAEASEIGTWEFGLDRLLWGLAMIGDEEKSLELTGSVWPCSAVNVSDVELLGKMITLLKGLEEDLKILREERRLKASEWILYLENLFQKYFSVTQEGGPFLQDLKQVGQDLKGLKEEVFTFKSMQRVVTSLTQRKQGTFHSPQLQKISFGSLKNNGSSPADVICLLGMSEGAFPRQEPKLSLSEMGSGEPPKRVEEDRYLFLELLSTAKKYFILSYQRINEEDNKEQGSSLIVQELLDYIEKSYKISSDRLCHEHPFSPFDARYFAEDSAVPSYCQTHFLAASAYYGPAIKRKPFLEKGEEKGLKEEEVIIDLKHLADLSRHPIRFYFQQALQIYMQSEEEVEREEFLLSPIVKAYLRRSSLKGTLEARMRALTAQGKLPLGPFHQVAIESVAEEVEELQEQLRVFGVNVDEIITVEFSFSCHTPVKRRSDYWILPALRVPLEENREAVITGKLGDISPQGLIVHGEDDPSDWVKIWPLFLVYLNMQQLPFEKKNRLLLTKSGHIKEGDFPTLLSSYLSYYERCLVQMSPLMPDWADSLLFKGEKELQKDIEQSVSGQASFEDEYLLFLNRSDALPQADRVFKEWGDDLKTLFSPMVSSWQRRASRAEI